MVNEAAMDPRRTDVMVTAVIPKKFNPETQTQFKQKFI